MLNFLKGFLYAFNGLVIFFRHERNGRIQMVIAIVVVIVSWWLNISAPEWMVVLGCIGTVLSLEMINSAIEKICNLVHPTYHPAIKTIKDMSASAVLFVSIISTIIGAIIFLPKIHAF
ncbi:diacylglycerol kinase family protein [Segetibacter aerophilus]|nr:diacylglycerol kinase family protein [Segetibacter aerophilus]